MAQPKKGISPEQLRQLSKELNLTVAAIAEGTGLSKAYVSEFRNETRNLSVSQQAQLRTFLESECQAQAMEFPEAADEPTGSELAKSVGGFIGRISRPALLLSDELPKAQMERLTTLVESNRLKVSDLLAQEFTPAGLFDGEFSQATEDAIRQIFALLALNYVAILLLQGSNLVRKLPEAYEVKTMGDWLSQYLADSPLGELLPADAPSTEEAPA
jgi:transcriptional regulator with XRE-family HTH domain